jgi:maltose alpha-D-glucosyltransferase / alpha-amylase
VKRLVHIDQIANALAQALVNERLHQFRWFGDRHRRVRDAHIHDVFLEEFFDHQVGTAIGRLLFADGGTEQYQLPFVISEGAIDLNAELAALHWEDEQRSIIDGPTSPVFREWLLATLTASRRLSSGDARYEFTWHGPDIDDSKLSLLSGASRLAGVEQSNTTIVYGRELIVKLHRRLSEGVNPELEIAKHLVAIGAEEAVPELFGSAIFARQQGVSMGVAIAQRHVGDNVDLWTELNRLLSVGEISESLDIVEDLGRVTAELHGALATPTWDDAFSTEVISRSDVEAWTTALNESFTQTLEMLSENRETVRRNDLQVVEAIEGARESLIRQAEGFSRLVGRRKCRVHGDYHLGQVLYTSSGHLKIIDFEGEPKRTLAERRVKTSPLKDVAGMLRSLAYARGSVQLQLQSIDASKRDSVIPLVEWERHARDRFLTSYQRQLSTFETMLIPESSDELMLAVRAWELDKAIYEVQYELSSRPDWLWLPLSSLVKQS